MSGFDYSNFHEPKCIPVEQSPIPTGSRNDPIFVADPCPRFIPTGFKDIASGLPIMAKQDCTNGDGQPPFPLGYFDENGVFQMSNSQTVGVNTAAAKTQFSGTYHTQFIAADGGGNIEVSAADIIAKAIADGAMLVDGFGGSQALTAADLIHSIDMALVPKGGQYGPIGAELNAATSNAVYYDNGGDQNVDPSGSACSGNTVNGWLAASQFEKIVIAEGSVIDVAVNFVTIPA